MNALDTDLGITSIDLKVMSRLELLALKCDIGKELQDRQDQEDTLKAKEKDEARKAAKVAGARWMQDFVFEVEMERLKVVIKEKGYPDNWYYEERLRKMSSMPPKSRLAIERCVNEYPSDNGHGRVATEDYLHGSGLKFLIRC